MGTGTCYSQSVISYRINLQHVLFFSEISVYTNYTMIFSIGARSITQPNRDYRMHRFFFFFLGGGDDNNDDFSTNVTRPRAQGSDDLSTYVYRRPPPFVAHSSGPRGSHVRIEKDRGNGRGIPPRAASSPRNARNRRENRERKRK